MCMNVLPICMYVWFVCFVCVCVFYASGSQKRVSDFLELDLRMVVSCHMDARN